MLNRKFFGMVKIFIIDIEFFGKINFVIYNNNFLMVMIIDSFK